MLRPRYFELVLYKGLADLNSEASRAYIGFVWWVLEPLLYMGAFYVAFGLGLRSGGAGMLFFLLCGLVPWKWFASTVSNGSHTIQNNVGLIQQIYLPKYILPWISLVTSGVKFMITLGLLLLLALFVGHGPSVEWVGLPAVIVTEMLLAVSVASLTAAIVPLLPDLGLIVDNGLIVMMFMSGIFFNTHNLPPKMRAIVELNPMVAVINGFHDILMDGHWPNWIALAWVAAFSLVMYAIAYAILRHFDRIYPKVMIG